MEFKVELDENPSKDFATTSKKLRTINFNKKILEKVEKKTERDPTKMGQQPQAGKIKTTVAKRRR